LDLADARLAVEEAEAELAEVQEIRSKNPAALSEQEMRKKRFQVERAKIQVQRIQIQLDEAKAVADSIPPTPSTTLRGGKASR
jgi:hypothetical protein